VPLWPLPRRVPGPSDEEIRKQFARHNLWHYAYQFDGGLSFPTRHHNPGLDTDDPRRPLQRFSHFMPYLIESQGGSLKGKRVLDIACNSGFWSIQCALLGAEVVGFDARSELIEQANLLKWITGIDGVEFRVLDFWQMSPEALGGAFDVVLNLGFLYHVPKPVEALELTKRMSRKRILLDTAVHPSGEFTIHLKWEEPVDVRMAVDEGIVALPTKPSVELMLRHLKVKGWSEIPVRSQDMPLDYLTGRRASWLIEV
jgi:SAM-dependent methyltransferase